MKSADPAFGELRDLLTRLSDGTQTGADARRLNELLRGDPEASEFYLNHAALEAQLHREFGAVPAAVPPGIPAAVGPVAARGQTVAFPSWLRYAAAVVLAVGGMWLASTWLNAGRAPRTQAVSGEIAPWVATVLFSEGCQWRSGRVVSEGERLTTETLHLAKGLAILRFDGGAEMVLRGETELELQSATHAKLLRGDVVVRAEGEAAGFKLDTPSVSLLDLGTEFAVKVVGGGTELHVSEGAVAYAQGGVTETLPAGKAVRLERARPAEAIAADAPRFAQLVREANPRERPEMMLAHDGFNYEEGSHPPGKIAGGKGWAGPWRVREKEVSGRSEADTTTDMHIVQGPTNLPWRMNRGGIGMLELPTGVCVRIRPMSLPLDMHRDGITYFSLITQEPARPSGRSRETIRLTFRSSADEGDFLSFGYGQHSKPFIRGASFGIAQSLSPVPDGQSLLWIGKIICRAEGDDEVSFRIYGEHDALDFAEPGAWHVTRSVRMKAALDLLLIASSGNAPRRVDELRIGATWRSVVPISTFRAHTAE